MLFNIQGHGQRADTVLVGGVMVSSDTIVSIMHLNNNKDQMQNNSLHIYTPALSPAFSFLKVYDFKVYNMADFIIYNRLNITPLWLREQYPVPYYIQQQQFFVIKKRKKK